jgi:hypothetical protein
MIHCFRESWCLAIPRGYNKDSLFQGFVHGNCQWKFLHRAINYSSSCEKYYCRPSGMNRSCDLAITRSIGCFSARNTWEISGKNYSIWQLHWPITVFLPANHEDVFSVLPNPLSAILVILRNMCRKWHSSRDFKRHTGHDKAPRLFSFWKLINQPMKGNFERYVDK